MHFDQLYKRLNCFQWNSISLSGAKLLQKGISRCSTLSSRQTCRDLGRSLRMYWSKTDMIQISLSWWPVSGFHRGWSPKSRLRTRNPRASARRVWCMEPSCHCCRTGTRCGVFFIWPWCAFPWNWNWFLLLSSPISSLSGCFPDWFLSPRWLSNFPVFWANSQIIKSNSRIVSMS